MEGFLEAMAEWSKAADCKSVRKLALVRIQLVSLINKNRKITNLKRILLKKSLKAEKDYLISLKKLDSIKIDYIYKYKYRFMDNKLVLINRINKVDYNRIDNNINIKLKYINRMDLSIVDTETIDSINKFKYAHKKYRYCILSKYFMFSANSFSNIYNSSKYFFSNQVIPYDYTKMFIKHAMDKYFKYIKRILVNINLNFKLIYDYGRINYLKENLKMSYTTTTLTESNRHIFTLNFKKNKFFPYLSSEVEKQTLFNSSLGIFSRKFSLKKSFLRSKGSYLMSASFLRRMLLYLNLWPTTTLEIVKIPKYLTEILTTMFSNASAFHIDPFSGKTVSESNVFARIIFDRVIFTNNKCYGTVKRKKRGRVKRKIARKLFLYNKVAD